MRHRAAQEGHVLKPRQRDIGEELAAPFKVPDVLAPQYADPDAATHLGASPASFHIVANRPGVAGAIQARPDQAVKSEAPKPAAIPS